MKIHWLLLKGILPKKMPETRNGSITERGLGQDHIPAHLSDTKSLDHLGKARGRPGNLLCLQEKSPDLQERSLAPQGKSQDHHEKTLALRGKCLVHQEKFLYLLEKFEKALYRREALYLLERNLFLPECLAHLESFHGLQGNFLDPLGNYHARQGSHPCHRERDHCHHGKFHAHQGSCHALLEKVLFLLENALYLQEKAQFPQGKFLAPPENLDHQDGYLDLLGKLLDLQRNLEVSQGSSPQKRSLQSEREPVHQSVGGQGDYLIDFLLV